ncbi:uncharacterized protein LOC134102072 isoform X2 [Sardina pilchardus]|uniref:uncharacterized protein LOC134102072 isoform X2 n=2 Tax=Sardina pilchardus TaxID=27697 RepID=UPI002E119D61
MSDTELEELKKKVTDLIDEEDLLMPSSPEPAPSTSQPVKWVKRDSDGNIIFDRPRSSRRPPSERAGGQSQHRHRAHARATESTSADAATESTSAEADWLGSDTTESFLQELQQSVATMEEEPTPQAASCHWGARKALHFDWWVKERPQFLNAVLAAQHGGRQVCQHCGREDAIIRCRDCRPRPFFCSQCDVHRHSVDVLHNRDTTVSGYFQPLPPTECLSEGTITQCVRLVPLEMPKTICGCALGSQSVHPGKSVAVVTMNGRYDLSLPEMKCAECNASWIAEVGDLVRSDYWPATEHFATVYAMDVFSSYEDMKMAAPGLSCQAFLRMIDQRTIRFGRSGKVIADSFRRSFLEWEAVQFEVDGLCKEDHFACTACTPEMLAICVDGNRKHYRFKSAARTEEQTPIFGDAFIALDEEVQRFVEAVRSMAHHVPGSGFCGGQWTAARETSRRSNSKVDEEGLELAVCRHGVLLHALNMFRGEIFAYPMYLQNKLACKSPKFFAMDVCCKYWPYLQKVAEKCPELQHLLNMKPFLSVFHAKAHDLKCEVKWSGAYQEGAGSTLGEEVEQCNAFLSRIAVTTKHMSKAGRTDTLTLMAMRWNQQKLNNLATALAGRYQKATKALEIHVQDLEVMKRQLSVTQVEVAGWVTDIKEWAEATTSHLDVDLHAVASRIEGLVASIKRRSQRLYRDHDGCKSRARFRRKIREEKAILKTVVEVYNTMVPDGEKIEFDSVLDTETVWPWHLLHGDSVDMKTKRKAFDLAMAISRLEEERNIVAKEMQKHWQSLSTQTDILKQLSCSLSTDSWRSGLSGLGEEAMKGLHSVLLKKTRKLMGMMEHARHCYAKVLQGANLDITEDSDDFDSDGELSE